MALAAPALAEADLVQRAQAGDRAAFGSLYESYLTPIYDFALGMVRNRADAEDVASATFLKAVERLGGLKDASAFKGWLYAIARNAALDLINARKRVVPVAEHFDSATTVEAPRMPMPADRAEQREMRELFDEASSTLSERDRTVFDLTVRHGLGSAEVARVLDVRPAYAYILVNRLKGSVTEALEAVVLSRVGRGDCPALAEVLGRFDGEVSPRMRKAVSRHANSCDACERTKRHRASVPALVAGMAFVQPAAAFAAELASHLDTHWTLHAPHGPSAPGGGGPTQIAGAAGIVVLIAAVVMGVSAQRTLVESEQGPTQGVSEVREPADDHAPVVSPPKAASGPAGQDPSLSGAGTGNRGSRITVTEGTSDGGSRDDGSSATNDSSVDSGRGSGSEDSGDDGGSPPS